MYGMGAIIHHFGMDESLCVLPEEIGLKDLDQFKKDFEILTTGMIPTLPSQEINKVVIFLVGSQGSGKTSKGKSAEKIWMEKHKHLFPSGKSVVYTDQDAFGNSTATQEEVVRLVKDDSVCGVVLGRTHHDIPSFKAYLEALREFPNVAVIFVGDEPDDVSEMISASGLVSRTDQELVNDGLVKFGSDNMEYGEAMEIVKKVLRSIYETFFGESPSFPIHIMKTITETPFRDELVREWSLLNTFEDQKSFLELNADKISAMRMPISDVGEALCQIFTLALSPSTPENARFLRTFNVNATHWPVHFELDFVSGKLSDDQGRPLITFAMEKLSEYGIHATTKSEGKGKAKPNGKVNPCLHMTIFHPSGEGLNPCIPDGTVATCEVEALVIHKETGHAAYRLRPSIQVQNKFPHFTVYVPNGRTPMQSNEFVGLNDDSVIIIPMNSFHVLELVVKNVAKK